MDFSLWALVEEFTVEDAACLWAGEEPRSVPYHPFPGKNPAPQAIVRALGGAIKRGELQADSSDNPNVSKGIFNWSRVKREDLRAYADRNGQRPAFLFDTLLSETAAEKTKQPALLREDSGLDKSKGGRPREYDWNAFTIEIIRIAQTPDGLPETQAALIEQMLQWCRDGWEKEPAASSVKNRISIIYNSLDLGQKP